MTPAKQNKLLRDQDKIAIKVFGCVPIHDGWAEHQIYGELERQGVAHASMHVVKGCLVKLKHDGLVKTDGSLWWQAPVSRGPGRPPNKPPALRSVPKPQPKIQEESVMAEESPKEKTSALERLSAALDKIEELELYVEEAREAGREIIAEYEKLHQQAAKGRALKKLLDEIE